MSRQGRSNRGGRRSHGKHQLSPADRKKVGGGHRQKVARRKIARDERHERFRRLLARIPSICAASRIGVAVPVLASRYVFITLDGKCVYKPSSGVKPEIIPWEEVKAQDLDWIVFREDWEPFLKKTALEQLADQAE